VLSHAYVPGIHGFIQIRIIKDVDGRDKPGHDNVGNSVPCRPLRCESGLQGR
jgi:hypothetical protein